MTSTCSPNPVTEGLAVSQVTLTTQKYPYLPLEIEHEIFVLAYHTSSGEDRTILLQVAKRTLEWLIRLIYRVVAIRDRSGPRFESLQKHGHLVRHLELGVSHYKDLPCSEDLLLSLFPNLIDLACWYNSAPITRAPNLFRIPLKRLSFHHIWDFGTQLTIHQKTPHVQMWCSNLTHLAISSIYDSEALDQDSDSSDSDSNSNSNSDSDSDSEAESRVQKPKRVISSLEFLTPFSNLTHFLTGGWNDKFVVQGVLDAVSSLRVVILLVGDFRDPDKVFVVQNEVGDENLDWRVVKINGHIINDWTRRVEGNSEDMWAIGEREVEERKAIRR